MKNFAKYQFYAVKFPEGQKIKSLFLYFKNDILQQELSEASSLPQMTDAANAGQTVFERIFGENRRKVSDAYKLSMKLFPQQPIPFVPLYREPSDIPELQEIRHKFDTNFRDRLVQHLKRLNQAKQIRVKNHKYFLI